MLFLHIGAKILGFITSIYMVYHRFRIKSPQRHYKQISNIGFDSVSQQQTAILVQPITFNLDVWHTQLNKDQIFGIQSEN